MNRLRFSRPGGQPAEPVAPASNPRAGSESRAAAPEQAPLNLAHIAAISREDREVIEHVQSRLLAEPSNPNVKRDADYFQRRIATLVQEYVELTGRVISDRERARIARLAQAELLGLGPLEPLLADETITEIMVNGPEQIWVEREGKLLETSARFADEDHIRLFEIRRQLPVVMIHGEVQRLDAREIFRIHHMLRPHPTA